MKTLVYTSLFIDTGLICQPDYMTHELSANLMLYLKFSTPGAAHINSLYANCSVSKQW